MSGEHREREIVLVRHAETEWSLSGRHTGNTDIPLTDHGREVAKALAPALAAWSFERVLCSPLQRARETCELAGLGAGAQIREQLREWDYGEYEGLTTQQIHAKRPDWVLWRDGCAGGESPEQVGARADKVIAELRELEGDVAIFAHGHILRVLGARWIELRASNGAHLGLSAGAISVLSHEHESTILALWNRTRPG